MSSGFSQHQKKKKKKRRAESIDSDRRVDGSFRTRGMHALLWRISVCLEVDGNKASMSMSMSMTARIYTYVWEGIMKEGGGFCYLTSLGKTLSTDLPVFRT
jgi:hypothetical protein